MQSQIQRYFAGKTVFLTGATGFLGKVLVEKLLRTCSDVNRIWLLVRNKTGMEPADRLRTIFSEPAFEPLRTQTPNFLNKVSILPGDCERTNLGLNQNDLNVLRNDVNIIIHCAATVRFNESLRKATNINVRPVQELINIAKEMKQLDSFVHVSTAYSHCVREDISEAYYEPGLNDSKLQNLVNTLDDKILDSITPTVIGEWPNTYTFTKAIAEDVVKNEGKSLPISIVRPSIIIASAKEPLPGWVDNVFGCNRLPASSLMGVLRTFHLNPAKIADLVPVDYVANTLLAAAWETGKKNTINTLPTVYNCVSGCQNPITWGELGNSINKYAIKEPSLIAKWHFLYYQIFNKYIFKLSELVLHTLPAYTVDAYLYCAGKKPTFLNYYKSILKYSKSTVYFMTHEWYYRNDNMQNLWNRMNARDKKLFEFDMRLINWDEYFLHYVRGIRVYVLKDPLDTLPKARRKATAFKIAHYGLVSLVLSLFAFLFYKTAMIFVN